MAAKSNQMAWHQWRNENEKYQRKYGNGVSAKVANEMRQWQWRNEIGANA